MRTSPAAEALRSRRERATASQRGFSGAPHVACECDIAPHSLTFGARRRSRWRRQESGVCEACKELRGIRSPLSPRAECHCGGDARAPATRAVHSDAPGEPRTSVSGGRCRTRRRSAELTERFNADSVSDVASGHSRSRLAGRGACRRRPLQPRPDGCAAAAAGIRLSERVGYDPTGEPRTSVSGGRRRSRRRSAELTERCNEDTVSDITSGH